MPILRNIMWRRCISGERWYACLVEGECAAKGECTAKGECPDKIIFRDTLRSLAEHKRLEIPKATLPVSVPAFSAAFAYI